MICKCIDCGKNIPHGCKRCKECNEKALKTTLARCPELKRAFGATVNEMRKPENIEKMVREITPHIQAVAVLQKLLIDGGERNAL